MLLPSVDTSLYIPHLSNIFSILKIKFLGLYMYHIIIVNFNIYQLTNTFYIASIYCL